MSEGGEACDRLPRTGPPLIGRGELQDPAQPWFRARDAEGTGAAVAFEGMAGTGKTALALAAAHRLQVAVRSERPVLFARPRGTGRYFPCHPGRPRADP